MPLPQDQAARVQAVAGWLDPSEADHLYDLARDVRDGCIVEVGAYRGRSTAALGLGSLAGFGAPVYAIEPHEPFTGVYGGKFGPEDRRVFFQTMLSLELTSIVRLVNLSSEIVSPGWRQAVGLLWIDGDHRYTGVRRDLDCWGPHLSPGAACVFDDAIDPEIGPSRLIDELITAGWRAGATIGKTRTLHAPLVG